jgi:adenylylsulfate kinase-like enzyme
VTRVFSRDEISLYQYAHIGRVKLLVDHSTVADKPTKAQISFDEGRQG